MAGWNDTEITSTSPPKAKSSRRCDSARGEQGMRNHVTLCSCVACVAHVATVSYASPEHATTARRRFQPHFCPLRTLTNKRASAISPYQDKHMNTNTGIRQSVGFIDKLAYLLPTSKLLGPEVVWLTGFQGYVRSAMAAGVCAPFFGGSGRFRGSAQLVLPSGAHAVVSYGRKGKRPQRFGVRVECNPGAMLDADVAAIHRFFIGAFGEHYVAMLTAPRIKRMDIAVDIQGLALDDVFVSYAHAQHVTMFGKTFTKARGNVETLMFGSVTSNSAGAVYSKRTESLHKLLVGVAKGGVTAERLSDNVVRQMKSSRPVVRIEVRLRKLTSSVADLVDLENKFLRFTFVEYEDMSLIPERVRLAFRSMCRDIGLKAALNVFKGHPLHRRLTRLSRGRPRWWEPEKAWREAISYPIVTKLFTAPSSARARRARNQGST